MELVGIGLVWFGGKECGVVGSVGRLLSECVNESDADELMRIEWRRIKDSYKDNGLLYQSIVM